MGRTSTLTQRSRVTLSPGSTLRHQISTLSRHYPDTTPTPRHSDTSVNRHSARHSDTSVRPVSSHLDVGHPRMASSSVNGVKKQNRHSDTRHPRHADTTGLDANEVQASMLTGLMMSRCLVCGKCVRGITHLHDLSCRRCALSCAHQVPSPPDSRAIN